LRYILLAIFILLASPSFAASWLGDVAAGATVYGKWSTNAATGAAANPSVDGTLIVEKDGNTTTTAGVTDTRGVGGVGVHTFAIDTSADGFYATGHDFAVWLRGATIDGVAGINAVVGQFSIQHRYMRGTDNALTTSAEVLAAIAAIPTPSR